MKKATKRQSHHILVGLTSVIAAIVTIVGIIGLASYFAIDSHGNSFAPASSISIKPHSTLSPLALSVTSTVDHNTPDTHLPPIVDGMVPVINDLPTKQPVVFLTIDDGEHKSSDELPALIDNHLHTTLFLAKLFIGDNPGFFTDFARSGNLIEDHTLSHDINMVDETYDRQKAEICGMADYEQQQYGRRPVLYRPPGGAYNDTMRRAAADCGMKALVTWIAKANGGSMQYQIGDHLLPGDIVLMHFRPEFQQDLHAFLDAMNSQHLHTEQLETWLQ